MPDANDRAAARDDGPHRRDGDLCAGEVRADRDELLRRADRERLRIGRHDDGRQRTRITHAVDVARRREQPGARDGQENGHRARGANACATRLFMKLFIELLLI